MNELILKLTSVFQLNYCAEGAGLSLDPLLFSFTIACLLQLFVHVILKKFLISIILIE